MSIKNILIVDDDQCLRQTIAEVLERDGWTCFRASCANEAIDIARQYQINASILDLHLGMRSGLETLVELRLIHSEIAAILISGHLTEETRIEAKQLGVLSLLGKPIELENLRNAVSRLMV